MPNFAFRIKELREDLPGKVSQNDLAKMLSIRFPDKIGKMTSRTISDWESGRTPPRWGNALLLAQFFDVSLDYLAGDDTDRGHAPTIDEGGVSGPPTERSEASEENAAEGAALTADPRQKRKRRGPTRRPES